MKRTATIILLCALACALRAQCTASNTAFQSGEDLRYQLYFNWRFIWIKAGTANFSITETTYEGQPSYRCHLITTGSKRTDKFFVMRDTLMCYVSKDMVPLYYRKGAQEGKRYTVDEVWYSYGADGTVSLRQRYRNHRGEVRTLTHTSRECTYDMVSMLVRARSFDAESFSVGQHLTFPMAEGDDVKTATIVYRGKKEFKMSGTGVTYRCLVFSFVEFEDKKEREVVTFYITDDLNHAPVRLDMFLRFGTAKAFLLQHNNLRNPQTSIVSAK